MLHVKPKPMTLRPPSCTKVPCLLGEPSDILSSNGSHFGVYCFGIRGRGTLLGKAIGSSQNAQDGNTVNLKTAAPYECNHITRTPANRVEIIYERRRKKGSMEKKIEIIKDDHEQSQVKLVSEKMVEKHQNSVVGEDLAIDVLTNLAIDVLSNLAADVLTHLKESASHSTPKLGTHSAPLGKASKPKDSNLKVCKAKCKRKHSPSRKEALKNTITKSPKHGKRRWYPQKSSRAYRLVTEFGHMLIEYDIRVWWPIDQMFFKGTIADFDCESKRHTIEYVDGDVETLDLTKECWHFADLENLNPILDLETYEGPPPPPPRKSGGSRKKRRH